MPDDNSILCNTATITRVQGLGGLRFRVKGLGFRVKGLELIKGLES